MKTENEKEYITRQEILDMLSDEEVTKVAIEEEPSRLIEGDEYIDLEHLERGIQQVLGGFKKDSNNVLARSVVRDETWAKIINKLPH
jgi:hypothetical protein